MTIEEFISDNNFLEVEKFGKIKGTTYYIEKDLSDEEIGIPFIVKENSGKFSVCDSDEALEAISIFGNEN